MNIICACALSADRVLLVRPAGDCFYSNYYVGAIVGRSWTEVYRAGAGSGGAFANKTYIVPVVHVW